MTESPPFQPGPVLHRPYVEVVAERSWTRCRSLADRKSGATWIEQSDAVKDAWCGGVEDDCTPLLTEVDRLRKALGDQVRMVQRWKNKEAHARSEQRKLLKRFGLTMETKDSEPNV